MILLDLPLIWIAECICNPIGTDPNGGDCDRVTGQCPCLPNVIGQKCDMSAPGYYNMTEGKGSEPCNCDPDGAIGIECNEVGWTSSSLKKMKSSEIFKKLWNNEKSSCST